MIQRQSEAVQFKTRDTREVSAQDVGVAPIRPNQVTEVGDSNWRNSLVKDIAGPLVQALDKMAVQHLEDQYLEGQALAGQIQSEEEIEGNPLTRDWKVAGYRDVMGKLSMADQQAQLAKDMVWLREEDPQAMHDYLVKQRNAITPTLNSLSRQERANTFGKLLLSERTAITKHGEEHQKFQVDQQTKAIRSSLIPSMQLLTDERTNAALSGSADSTKAYQARLDQTAGILIADVWQNERLPTAAKQKLTAEYLGLALASENIGLYEFLTQQQLGDSTGGDMLSRLDGDDVLKLSKQYQETLQKTVAERNMNFLNQKGKIESDMDAGTYNGTYEQTEQFYSDLVARRVIGPEGYTAGMNKYYDSLHKRGNSILAGDSYLRGDMQGLTHAGGEDKGREAIRKRMALQGMPLKDQISTWAVALNNNMASAGEEIGKLLGPAVMSLANPDGTKIQANTEALQHVNNLISTAPAEGQDVLASRIMQGMTADQRTKFQSMRRYAADGMSTDMALAEMAKQEKWAASLNEQQRAAIAQNKSTEINKSVQEITVAGPFTQFWQAITGSTEGTIEPRAGWFSDKTVANKYLQNVRSDVLMQAHEIAQAYPHLSSAEAAEQAMASTASRTVKTANGPLVVPRGSTVDTYFGVKGVPNGVIGQALDKITKPSQDGNRTFFEVRGRKVIMQEYTPDGAVTGVFREIEPKQVQEAVREITDKRREIVGKHSGAGVTVQRDTASVTYNGVNTAGAEDALMYQFRTNLVQNEGVRDTPYEDLSGKVVNGKKVQTVGVGVSSHNKHFPKVGPDGRVDKGRISESFKGASNDAAKAAVRLQRATGLQAPEQFLLFAELAYQSGEGFVAIKDSTGNKPYGTLVDRLIAKDSEGAKQAFMQTPAYKHSGDSRRKHYMTLIEKSLKG